MMDLTNIINDEQKYQMNQQFNTCQLNMEKQDISDIPQYSEQYVNAQQLQEYQNRQNMLKDMFNLLSTNQNPNIVISAMQNKYGSLFDDNCVAICQQLCDLIGNFFITCKYNDNLGNKNQSLVKYVLFCDCPSQESDKQQYIAGGNVDGFFGKDAKVIKSSKIKICKKHNLPVLAKIQDLSEQDFSKLAKQVSEIKNIPISTIKKNAQNKKKIVSKIASVFHSITANNNKKFIAKDDSENFKIKDANVQVKTNLANKFTQANVKDIQAPKGQKMQYTIAKQQQKQIVSLPANSSKFQINKKASLMKQITVKPNKYDDLTLCANVNSNVVIPGKNIQVAVQKQSKFVQNISIYTQPVKTQFDLSNQYSFDINNQQDDNLKIDTTNSFDF